MRECLHTVCTISAARVGGILCMYMDAPHIYHISTVPTCVWVHSIAALNTPTHSVSVGVSVLHLTIFFFKLKLFPLVVAMYCVEH